LIIHTAVDRAFKNIFPGNYFEIFVFYVFLPNISLFFLRNYINFAPTILEVLT